MIAFPPLARYRLYSSFSSYSTLLLDIVRGKLAAADKVAALESAACQVFGSENALATSIKRYFKGENDDFFGQVTKFSPTKNITRSIHGFRISFL